MNHDDVTHQVEEAIAAYLGWPRQREDRTYGWWPHPMAQGWVFGQGHDTTCDRSHAFLERAIPQITGVEDRLERASLCLAALVLYDHRKET